MIKILYVSIILFFLLTFSIATTVPFSIGLVVVLYLTQQAYDFSRLIYGIFLVLNILITYAVHMAAAVMS